MLHLNRWQRGGECYESIKTQARASQNAFVVIYKGYYRFK